MADKIICLFEWELDSMSEYSCSLPSATTPWKMWKYNENAFPNPGLRGQPAREPKWFVGQYGEPEGDSVPITWFTVVLRAGPKPQRYSPPDWDNYERWKSDYKKEKEEKAGAIAAKALGSFLLKIGSALNQEKDDIRTTQE